MQRTSTRGVKREPTSRSQMSFALFQTSTRLFILTHGVGFGVRFAVSGLQQTDMDCLGDGQ